MGIFVIREYQKFEFAKEEIFTKKLELV